MTGQRTGATTALRHIAYPLLALFFAFRFGTLRVFCAFFYLIMCFSAVYLNHHYLLDIFVGLGIALSVMAGARLLFGPLYAEPALSASVEADGLRQRQPVSLQ